MDAESSAQVTDLEVQGADHFASAARAVLGAIPFAGSFLAEIVGGVIPNQRVERITRFAHALNERLSQVEESFVRKQMADERFTDLVEEALRQSTRATSPERLGYIAEVLARGIDPESVAFIESKHILQILGELNDVEVVRLASRRFPMAENDFYEKNRPALEPVVATMDSAQSEIDRYILQESYDEHLARLGLLRPRYRVRRDGQLEINRTTGAQKSHSYELTPLGDLFLRQVGMSDGS